MKQPKIRFNGFEDEWTKIPLKDVISKISLKNKDTSVKYVESISNSRGFIPQSSQFSDRSVASKDLSNYTVIHEGDIAYNPSRINVGSIALKKSGTDVSVISPLYIAFRPKYDILSPWFLMEWLNTSNFESQRVGASEGGVRDTLSYGSFSRFKVQLPTLPEQQKIGALFSKYDAIISLYEQKLAELNALKKGMLQQMFDDGVATSHKPQATSHKPQATSHKPQVRFSGFNDEWVEKKLGEIANLYQPKTIVSTDLTRVGVPVFGANGYIGYYVAANHDTDQVAISARGANTGSINYVKGPVWITGNSMIVNVDGEPIDKHFLYEMLFTVNFSKYITGGAQPQLTRDVLIKVPIQLPTLPEQQKIGQLFKHLDARISNEQSKIEQLKAQKQGLLQKMIS